MSSSRRPQEDSFLYPPPPPKIKKRPVRRKSHPLPSPQQRLRLEAEQGSNDLFYFAKHILGYSLLSESVHQPLCDILSFRHVDYPRKRKLILLPRDTFKSTIGTIALPIHLLTRSPNLSILIDCEVFGTAKGFLSEIKARLEEPAFQARYGNWLPGRADSHRWTENLIENSVVVLDDVHASQPEAIRLIGYSLGRLI